jgi:flagellar biosynthesis/type III secretory pathway M-ring protein FliF/YscJ
MQFVYRYSGFALLVFILLTSIAIGYEVAYEDKDSMAQTIASVFRWFGPILEVQVILVIIWEGIIMVMAERLKAKYKEEGRAERTKEVQEWDKRRREALAKGEEFTEPIPGAQDLDKA